MTLGALNMQYSNLPLQVMMATYQSGDLQSYIQSIHNEVIQQLAWGEYYYFTGNAKKSIPYVEPYLKHEDKMIRLYAWLVYTFSNVSLGKLSLSEIGISEIQNAIELEGINESKENRLIWLLLVSSCRILFHLPMEKANFFQQSLKGLPDGVKLYCCYLMAHKLYTEKEYNRSLGIVQTILSCSENTYPILFILLNLVAAIDSINLKDIENAKAYFLEAWSYAKADHILVVIGQYHGLLKGLVELCVKEQDAEDYEEIIRIANQFGRGWMHVHDSQASTEAVDLLTSIEFMIASLAAEDWSNQEIADYLQISVRTVKYHIASIFNKFHIGSRKQIKEHLPN